MPDFTDEININDYYPEIDESEPDDYEGHDPEHCEICQRHRVEENDLNGIYQTPTNIDQDIIDRMNRIIRNQQNNNMNEWVLRGEIMPKKINKLELDEDGKPKNKIEIIEFYSRHELTPEIANRSSASQLSIFAGKKFIIKNQTITSVSVTASIRNEGFKKFKETITNDKMEARRILSNYRLNIGFELVENPEDKTQNYYLDFIWDNKIIDLIKKFDIIEPDEWVFDYKCKMWIIP